MEAIIFIGIQASGKSTFYKENFFNTHVRISNDLLKTKHREELLLEYCNSAQMSFVLDNTNVTRQVRANYINIIKQMKIPIRGYYFKSDIKQALLWNKTRYGKEAIPEKGIFSTHKKLELPSIAEGFTNLFYVEIVNGKFIIKDWQNEV
ncbi:MAG: AAA family ATPase [Candidatus Margulisbacteria bacterium]|jgi:predicted kinase|nr:AAA family ATPase [Candidatus Margulisiibacteriota bacterium]